MLLGCDVWEHSYYLDFRNRRPDYLQNWVDTLANYEYAEAQLQALADLDRSVHPPREGVRTAHLPVDRAAPDPIGQRHRVEIQRQADPAPDQPQVGQQLRLVH